MIFGIHALSASLCPAAPGATDLRELVEHLARIDPEHEYRVFTTRAGRSAFSTAAPNVRIEAGPSLGRSGLSRRLVEQIWLPLAARRAGVAAMLCPAGEIPRWLAPPVVMTVETLLSFSRSHPAPADGRLHRWTARFQERAARARVRAAAGRAAAVVAVSEQLRRETARYGGVDPQRIVVARPGVSADFQPVPDSERIAALLDRYHLRPPYLLTAGELSPYQCLDRAMEGLAQVRQWSHRLPVFALVGEDRFGCRPGLERLAAALDLHEHVRFLGPLPRAVLPALYTAATACLALSASEASGLSMVEAMACGCPVICARRSSPPEVAGEAALFVDPDRPQEVAEAIWRLATLPNVRDVWIERGLAHARRFDWRETARITRAVLLAVAEGAPLPKQPIADRSPAPAKLADGKGRRGE